MVKFFIRLDIVFIAVKSYGNPFTAFKAVRKLNTFRRGSQGGSGTKKIVKVGNRYFWRLYVPGWPSTAFSNYITTELNRIIPVKKKVNRFKNIFIAITKKCYLQCEHCYEWESHNKREVLTLDDLKDITNIVQEAGTSLIQISGGEPLLRKREMVNILKAAEKGTDFWMLTSGYQFTADTAQDLKNAGLTGASISLENYVPSCHNTFRGNEKAFEWVERAVKNCIDAGIVVNLSLCATKSFSTRENLEKYLALAEKWGVAFILLLEPRDVGHYNGQDVGLTAEQYKILEEFFVEMNNKPQNRNSPIVHYNGYCQRRTGCSASGDQSLYIDADGNIQACPFCKGVKGNILTDGLEKPAERLLSTGCHVFEQTHKAAQSLLVR